MDAASALTLAHIRSFCQRADGKLRADELDEAELEDIQIVLMAVARELRPLVQEHVEHANGAANARLADFMFELLNQSIRCLCADGKTMSAAGIKETLGTAQSSAMDVIEILSTSHAEEDGKPPHQ